MQGQRYMSLNVSNKSTFQKIALSIRIQPPEYIAETFFTTITPGLLKLDNECNWFLAKYSHRFSNSNWHNLTHT